MKNKNIKKFSISSAMVVGLFLIEKLLYGGIANFECGFAMGMLAMYLMCTIGRYIETWCKKYLTAIKNAVNEVNNAPKQVTSIDDCYEYKNDIELQQSLEDQIHCLDIEPTPMAMKTEQKEKESNTKKEKEETKETKVSKPIQKTDEETKFVVPEEAEDSEDSVFDFSAFETNEEEFVFDFSAFETNESKESKAISTELGEGLEFDNLDDLLHHIST